MSNDGVDAGLSVAMQTRIPAECAERRHARAEDPVRPRAVRDRDVVLGEQRDLLLVGLDAVSRDHVRVE
jgi:hypothetical protein